MAKKQDVAIGPFQGWSLTIVLWLGVLAISLAAFALSADLVAGIRMVIRITARTSLLLFVLAFTASSLIVFHRSPATLWLRANRRQVGVAFALSHFTHAAAIIALARIDPVLFAALTTPASFIFGGAGYAVILAMFATSFDRTAALIGPKAWRWIHTAVAWFLAIMFVINFARRAVPMPGMYWPYMVLILAAIALRIAARRRNAAAPYLRR